MDETHRLKRRTALKAIGGTVLGTGVVSGSASASRLKGELATVRGATTAYKDVDKAIADGFVRVSPFICEMGYHYVKFSRVDGQLKHHAPEALVYGEDSNGDLFLGAAEFIIPTALQSSEPDIFSDGGTAESDGWHVNRELKSWTLHTWVHANNPRGVFNPTNPNEPFKNDKDEDCIPHE